MPEEYANVGDEGGVTLPNVISGAPTVLGSSYQNDSAVVLPACVMYALLYPLGDGELRN